MNKKKSIALLSVIAIVMVVLTVLTFARFQIPAYKNGTRIYQSFLGAVSLDQDLEGGVAYELTLVEDVSSEDEDIEENEVINTLQKRLSALGYDNAVVKAFRKSDTDAFSYRIEMRNTSSVATDISVVAAYGEIEFADGDSTYIMGADAVKSAKYTSQGGTSHYVELKFTSEGLATLKEALNSAESDFTLKIKLGDDELFSSTLKEDYIQDNAIYITSQSAETAKQLALQISSGGLKYEYEVSEQMSITSALGNNASEMIFWAVCAAVLVMFIASIVIYGGFGFIADLTVFAFILIEILMMILVPGITLNIGGVIGIIASIILTFDGMFFIMNRIRKEYANGKTVKASVKAAYGKSIFAVLDVNIIFAAFALLVYFICSGNVQCFAITFGIGAVISALATMFFSQLLVNVFIPLFKGKSEGFLNLKREEK